MASTLRKLSRRARDVLPAGAVGGLRQAATGWGWLTADMRLLPQLVIVGAQRAGTTTLFRLLEEHPAVSRATTAKGVGYFDLAYHRGPRWYRGHFALAAPAALRAGRGVQPITFESSGYYSFHPLAVPRIARDLPEARLLYIVRNPVDRAHSAHRHELSRGFESEDFQRALELEGERLEGEEAKILADPRYESYHHRHHAYLARGRYAEQLQRMYDHVGRDRVFVMDADDFFADPTGSFVQLQEWLGLPVWKPREVAQWNAERRDPLDAQTRARLMTYFEPYDAELTRLTGPTPSWRR